MFKEETPWNYTRVFQRTQKSHTKEENEALSEQGQSSRAESPVPDIIYKLKVI